MWDGTVIFICIKSNNKADIFIHQVEIIIKIYIFTKGNENYIM